jgi:GT2 family glycosyltransferase
VNIVAVVLNWRRPDDTIGCLRSLRADADLPVVVVDNASGDDSAERIREADRDATLIVNDSNQGYAGGNNRGIEAALAGGADAVLILNNDLTVQPGCVAALRARLSAQTPIVAPVSLRADDPGICDFWRAEVEVSSLSVRAYGRDEPWSPPSEPQPTDYATGSALLIDRSVFDRVGTFDERYFLVWEDVDLCLRARAKGAAILAVPDAAVLHSGSSSFGGAGAPLYRYFFARNSFLLLDKHLRWPQRARTKAAIERRYREGIARQTDEAVRAALERGIADGRAKRFGPPPSDLLT